MSYKSGAERPVFRILFYVFVLISFVSASLAEELKVVNAKSKGMISGRIIDGETKAPLAYATVNLHSKIDNELLTGTISKSDGTFKIEDIEFGTYHITVKFIGFDTKDVTDIVVTSDNSSAELGTIYLNEDAVLTEEIVVEADKKAVEYQIDRKVVNVDKTLSYSSGTAVDILKTVPSIQTDLLGNVTLRGSGSFLVMIDGRRSILEPSDALQQIPSSTIDKIEIITNPSSKFDPDGTSGIINIILKKENREGTSGLITFNIGENEQLGGDALITFKNTDYSFFVGADYNQSDTPGNVIENSTTSYDGLVKQLDATGIRNWAGNRYGIRGGVEVDLDDNNKLSLQSRWGGRFMNARSNLAYEESVSNAIDTSRYLSKQNWERKSDYFSVIFDYIKTFDSPEHKLAVQLDYSSHYGEEESRNEMFGDMQLITFGSLHTEDGPSDRFIPKIDYTLPISKTDKFEAGYQSRFGYSQDITGLYDYDFVEKEYVKIEEFSNNIYYYRDIHSVYSQYSGEVSDIGYQGGLRGEYTYRKIEQEGDSTQFNLDRWDWFPTAFLSYKFDDELQGTVNYTKRIERPRGWYLEPFITKIDAFNLRRGNPELLPEYIDAFELGILKYFDKNTLSVEGFYRRVVNKTERVKYLIDGDRNLFMNTIENVGTDYSLGAEVMFDIEFSKIFDMTLSGSGYQYIIESTINGYESRKSSFNWNSKLKTNLKFTKTTNFEFTFNYNSNTVYAQGVKEGFIVAGAAIRQDLFDNRLSLTLQAEDLFNTNKDEYLSSGSSYEIYNYYKIDAPIFSLTIKYNFNNSKSQNTKQGNEGSGEVF